LGLGRLTRSAKSSRAPKGPTLDQRPGEVGRGPRPMGSSRHRRRGLSAITGMTRCCDGSRQKGTRRSVR
jgi:hypothetical protein